MKLSFQRSGGFAAPAQRLAFTLDTADLSPADAATLTALVESAPLQAATDEGSGAGRARAARPAPDEFHYRITMQEGERQLTASASDTEMPEQLRPLVEWLEQHGSTRREPKKAV